MSEEPVIRVGDYNTLKVIRGVDFGVYLDDGAEGILLPKRFVPAGLRIGDEITVFIYHDSESRLVATTQHPVGKVGEIVRMKALSVTPQGAFLDWGLMKDIFVPKSKQLSVMRQGADYLVLIYIDEQTGRVAATEKFETLLDNDELTVKEGDEVDLTVFRRTDIGYLMIVNHRHTGVLHHNEVYREMAPGDRMKGFVKKIRPGNKLDLVAGRKGYERVEDEAGKILRMLQEQGGYLPYHDKSDPDEIYLVFGMSKKAFKMAVGKLYKQNKIMLAKTGIKLIE